MRRASYRIFQEAVTNARLHSGARNIEVALRVDRDLELIVLVDSSKFANPSGIVLCDLARIDVLITDPGITAEQKAMVEGAGIRLIVAD